MEEISDPTLIPNSVKCELGKNLKASVNIDDVSIATASVTTNGETKYFVSVSGKSYSGAAPDIISVNGTTYTVIRMDSGSVPPSPNGNQTNFNHAEQKLFSHIQSNYSEQGAKVSIAVQNTSAGSPGMCAGCSTSFSNFSSANPNLDITIYHGSSGNNP